MLFSVIQASLPWHRMKVFGGVLCLYSVPKKQLVAHRTLAITPNDVRIKYIALLWDIFIKFAFHIKFNSILVVLHWYFIFHWSLTTLQQLFMTKMWEINYMNSSYCFKFCLLISVNVMDLLDWNDMLLFRRWIHGILHVMVAGCDHAEIVNNTFLFYLKVSLHLFHDMLRGWILMILTE